MSSGWRKNLPFILRNILFLLLGLLILYLVMVGVGISEVIEHLARVNYWWLFLPKVFFLFSHLTRAFRWKLILNSLGYQPGLFNAFLAVLTTYLTNIGLPRFGEVFRCWVLKKQDGIPINESLGSVVVERAFDAVSLILMLMGILVFQFDFVGNFIINNIFLNLWAKIKMIVIDQQVLFYVLAAITVLVLALFYVFRAQLRKTTVYQKGLSFLGGIWRGIMGLKKLEHKGLFLLQTGLIWAFFFTHFQMMYLAMEETASLSIPEGFFVFTIKGFGMAAPIQAGIGAFHWLASEGLQAVGVAEGPSVAWALAAHASGMVANIVFGAIALLILIFKIGKETIKTIPKEEMETTNP